MISLSREEFYNFSSKMITIERQKCLSKKNRENWEKKVFFLKKGVDVGGEFGYN